MIIQQLLIHTMSNTKGSRSPRRRPSACARDLTQQQLRSDRKMRSRQSLHERFCFTPKRPRSCRSRASLPCRPNSSLSFPPPSNAGKPSVMDNGLIQIPHFHCDFYCDNPTATLSFSSPHAHVSPRSTSTSSVTSSITHIGLPHSPNSSSENSSDDGFSSDEVMNLVGCSDFIKQNVLDFMPATLEGHASNCCQDETNTEAARGSRCAPDMCSKADSALDSSKEECCSSVEDDGEPYRIDLCDFEPDVSAMSSGSNEQHGEGAHREKRRGGGVLCLRLDYEEVLRAWKERGEFFIAKEPSNYPSPYLDSFHTFSHAHFVPQPP